MTKRILLIALLLLASLAVVGCGCHRGMHQCNSGSELSAGQPCPQHEKCSKENCNKENCTKAAENKPCCEKMKAAQAPQ